MEDVQQGDEESKSATTDSSIGNNQDVENEEKDDEDDEKDDVDDDDDDDAIGIEDNFEDGVNTNDDDNTLPFPVDKKIGEFLCICRGLVDAINGSAVLSFIFSFILILIQEVCRC